MIEIRKLEETPVQLYAPDDSLVGTIDNHLSFEDVRVQIKRQGVSGYYVVFKDTRIDIDKDGRCPIWPDGFFDTWDKLIIELL